MSANAGSEISGAGGPGTDARAFIADLRRRLAAQERSTVSLPSREDIDAATRQVFSRMAAKGELLRVFCEAAVKAGFLVHVSSHAGWAAIVRGILVEKEARTIWLGADFGEFGETAAAVLSDEFERNGISATHDWGDDEMFSVAAAVTGVSWAVAETGSIVCESGAGRPRGASLIPPVHIALVKAEQILADLCDLFDVLGGRGELPANVNLITGPSKTGDIEGVLVTGVHGPGEVHVVIVDDE